MAEPVLLLPLVEARLATVAEFKQVQGALDLSAIQFKPIPVSPMAFVVPLTDEPGENQRYTGNARPLQGVTLRLAVVIALKNMADPYGKQGNAQLELLKLRCRDKLHGWVPAPEHDAMELGKGGLIAMKDYTLFWQMEFRTHTYYEGTGNDS
jgi:hypothetical protein